MGVDISGNRVDRRGRLAGKRHERLLINGGKWVKNAIRGHKQSGSVDGEEGWRGKGEREWRRLCREKKASDSTGEYHWGIITQLALQEANLSRGSTGTSSD